MTATSTAVLGRTDLVGSIAELRRQAVSVGRAFDVVRPMMNRARLLSINARLVSSRLGGHGAPFEVVAGSLDVLRAELGDLVGHVDEAFARIVNASGDYTQSEWALALVGRAVSANDPTASFPDGIAAEALTARGSEWRGARNRYLEDHASALDAGLRDAAARDRVRMIEDVHRLVAATHQLSQLIHRVERVATMQTFFLGTNALVEAARLDRQSAQVSKLALEIRDATRTIATAVRVASSQAEALVVLADRIDAALPNIALEAATAHR